MSYVLSDASRGNGWHNSWLVMAKGHLKNLTNQLYLEVDVHMDFIQKIALLKKSSQWVKKWTLDLRNVLYSHYPPLQIVMVDIFWSIFKLWPLLF